MRKDLLTKRRRVAFVDEKLAKSFDDLSKGTFEEKQLCAFISRALDDILEDPWRYIQIQRDKWPKEFIRKYNVPNLWKYDLPNGWRLIYTIHEHEVNILAIILEWFPHKEYEGRFGY